MLVRAFARLLDVGLHAPSPRTWRGIRVDAIVVLGAPIRADGTPSPHALERIEVGARLFRAGVAGCVLATGGHGAPRGSIEEREGMALWLRGLGVPDEALRVDRDADSTWTSAVNAARILGRGARVVLVTQPFHRRRALALFLRAGLEPVAVKIENGLEDRDSGAAVRWKTREHLARVKAFALGAVGLRGAHRRLVARRERG